MTGAERTALISKISLQMFRARHRKQGVVLSHQIVDYMLNELKRIEGLELLAHAAPQVSGSVNLSLLSTHDIKGT